MTLQNFLSIRVSPVGKIIPVTFLLIFLLNGRVVKLVMYADDIVLFVERPRDLQTMVDNFERFCNEWGLTLNMMKSEVMMFNKRHGRALAIEEWVFE